VKGNDEHAHYTRAVPQQQSPLQRSAPRHRHTPALQNSSANHLGLVLRGMWADGGVRGLFRGNLATVGAGSGAGVCSENACKARPAERAGQQVAG